LYIAVSELFLQKKVSILQQNIAIFPEQDNALRHLRKSIDVLETQRLDLLHAFWPNALEQVQAKMVALAMPESHRDDFERLRADLRKTLETVSSRQQECQSLLEASLDWINQSVNWVKESTQSREPLTYGANGRPIQRNATTIQRNI